jgi:predicted nucleic acid-binding protein
MTVLDTSGMVDYLLGRGSVDEVAAAVADRGGVAAPDVLAFEVLAVLRREVLRGQLPLARATTAVEELGLVALALFPSMPLREAAWGLRENLSAADALFLELARVLDEPLATKDRGLAAAARARGVDVVLLDD